MSWAYELTGAAEQDLHQLPKHIQKRIARVLKMMAGNPFQGDIKALGGTEWKNAFRRRLGDYRLIFAVDWQKQTISVVRILIRSKGTYR